MQTVIKYVRSEWSAWALTIMFLGGWLLLGTMIGNPV